MSDYFRPATFPVARNQYRCICCFGPIPKGEKHVAQAGFYDGDAFSHRFHDECWDALFEEGPDEFIPGSGDVPDRVKAQMIAKEPTHDQQ